MSYSVYTKCNWKQAVECKTSYGNLETYQIALSLFMKSEKNLPSLVKRGTSYRYALSRPDEPLSQMNQFWLSVSCDPRVKLVNGCCRVRRKVEDMTEPMGATLRSQGRCLCRHFVGNPLGPHDVLIDSESSVSKLAQLSHKQSNEGMQLQQNIYLTE